MGLNIGSISQNFKSFLKNRKFYGEINNSGLFDAEFYKNTYEDVSGDALNHYLNKGYLEGKFPSLDFDPDFYLKTYPDVAQAKINPLLHFIVHGRNEGKISQQSYCVRRKEEICETNLAFLSNYEFGEEPLVSIIILNRNGLNHLKRLFKDFDAKTNYSNYEIIVVDNASTDESVSYLKSLNLPIRVIENDVNVSFSKGNNDAAKIANGEYLLLLNNDIEPTYGWLNEMVGCMLNNESAGAVGAKLLFPYYEDMENQPKSYCIQHAGVKFREERTPYVYGPYHENIFSTLVFSSEVNHQKNVISNTAACLLIPKSVYMELGGLDENYFYGYEDIDFAFKLYENNYKSIYNPFALLFHHESATRVEDEAEKNRLNYENIMYFYNKWGDYLFKEILIDKINQNHFITDKKLDISIISKNDDFISKLVKDLNNMGFNVKLIPNLNNFDIGENYDILISNDVNYDVGNVISRLNIIKVLISSDNDSRYDICLDKTLNACELMDIIKEKYL